MRRPEAPSGDHEVCLGARGREGGCDRGAIVRQRTHAEQAHPEPRELCAEVRGVRVDRLAEQDLAADAEQLGGRHSADALAQRLDHLVHHATQAIGPVRGREDDDDVLRTRVGVADRIGQCGRVAAVAEPHLGADLDLGGVAPHRFAVAQQRLPFGRERLERIRMFHPSA